MSIETALLDLGTSLKAKADLDSPVFTGDPTVPTPPSGDKDKSIANTEFVKNAVDSAINGTTVYFSKDFLGSGSQSDAISIKPLYLSNNFKGTGSTTTDPITLDVLKLIPVKTPAKSSSPGVVGEICMDDKYLYKYIATNRWIRIAFSTTTW